MTINDEKGRKKLIQTPSVLFELDRMQFKFIVTSFGHVCITSSFFKHNTSNMLIFDYFCFSYKLEHLAYPSPIYPILCQISDSFTGAQFVGEVSLHLIITDTTTPPHMRACPGHLLYSWDSPAWSYSTSGHLQTLWLCQCLTGLLSENEVNFYSFTYCAQLDP